MRTVITVSLNGTAYQLETAAHDQLDEYLGVAERRLAGNPDRAEILSDLEQAIADKCNRHLGVHKNVVTTDEMAQILKEMGPVDAGTQGQETSPGASTASGPADAADTADAGGHAGPRPFYRIHEGQVIAGVCTGIAAYLGWHVSVVRALVIVLAIVTWGLLLLPYLAVAMLVPYAGTPEQQAAAHGRPFTADDVIRRARAQYEAFQQRGGFSGDWQAQRRQFRAQRRQWRAQQRFWRRQARWGAAAGAFPPPPALHPTGLVAMLCVPVLGLLSGILTLGFIFVLLMLVTHHGLPWLPLPGVPWWVALIMLCMVYGLVISPLHHARHACCYLPNTGAGAALIGTAVWLCLLGAGAWFAWQHWPQVTDLLQQAGHALQNLLQKPDPTAAAQI